MIYKLFRKITYTFLWILYPLTFVVPRKKNIWVFGGGLDRYADNAKYLFEFVSKEEPKINSYWISGKREVVKHVRTLGHQSYWRYSLKGMWLCLRAEVYVYSSYVMDINMWLNRGALKLNLWHGIGFIANESDIEREPLRKLYNPKNTFEKIYSILHSPHIWIKSFFLVAPSQLMAENHMRAFQLPKERIIRAGYPRLSPFYNPPEISNKWKEFKKVVLYMPTKRLFDMDGYLENAFPNPERLNQVCKENNILFVFKLHPMTSEKALKRFEKISNIELMEKSVDVYPFLPHTTALITDYSSIHADYAVLEKAILFYTIDLKEYLEKEATFTMDYDWITNGKSLTDPEALYNALNDLSNYEKEGTRLKDLYWEKDPKTACEDLTNWIKSKINY